MFLVGACDFLGTASSHGEMFLWWDVPGRRVRFPRHGVLSWWNVPGRTFDFLGTARPQCEMFLVGSCNFHCTALSLRARVQFGRSVVPGRPARATFTARRLHSSRSAQLAVPGRRVRFPLSARRFPMMVGCSWSARAISSARRLLVVECFWSARATSTARHLHASRSARLAVPGIFLVGVCNVHCTAPSLLAFSSVGCS